MSYVLAVAVGFLFGAADQYLGSRSALGPWTATVSQVSAPWLLLSFAAGMTQLLARRAMGLGLAIVLPALVGYFAMTCSPMESIPAVEFRSCFTNVVTVPYNPVWILGGVLFGPLFGLLGQRWRVNRWWLSAAAVTFTLLIEPLARRVATPWMVTTTPMVWWTEVAIGAVLAVLFINSISTARRTREVQSPNEFLAP
jgi:hypothetical protein